MGEKKQQKQSKMAGGLGGLAHSNLQLRVRYYGIRPNYHTVRLHFSKLLHKLFVVKYQPKKKDQQRT